MHITSEASNTVLSEAGSQVSIHRKAVLDYNILILHLCKKKQPILLSISKGSYNSVPMYRNYKVDSKM